MGHYDITGTRVVCYDPSGSGRYIAYRAWGAVDTVEYEQYIAYTFNAYLTLGRSSSKWEPGMTGYYSTSETSQQYLYYETITSGAETKTIYTQSGTITRNIVDLTRDFSVMFIPDYWSGSSGTYTTVSIPALASYTLSYNANGGSGAPGPQTIYYGKQFTTSATIPTRSGYTFMGWSTSSSGSVQYAVNTTYTESNHTNLTLYAVWHQHPTCSYSITSSSPYYAGYSSYTVNITSISGTPVTNGVTLKLSGSNSYGRSGSTTGTYSVSIPVAGTYTPSISITDSIATTRYTLSKITVKPNTAPTVEATVTSSPYYFGGHSKYSVNVTKAQANEGKSLRSVTLNVGGVTKTRTDTGPLTVTVPQVSATSTGTSTNVSVTAIDSLGVSKTATGIQSITIYPNNNPTVASGAITTSSAPYFGGVSTYTVKINATAGINKSITETKVTLTNGATVLTKTGSNNTTLSIPLPSVEVNTTYTVNLEATDSNGLKWQQSLDSITVFPNTPPTCEPTTNSGYFYAGISEKPYEVDTHEITTSNGKTVSEVKLILGTQSVSRTTQGKLSIVPQFPLNQEIPRLIITDNQGASREYNLSAITVYSNTPPTATITVNSNYSYYENTPDTAPTDYIVTLSNIQFYNYKVLKSITLTLGNQTHTITNINNNSATLTIRPNIQSTGLVPIITITDTFSESNFSNVICSTQTYDPTNNNELQNIIVNSRSLTSTNHMTKRVSSSGQLIDEGTEVVFITTINYSNYVVDNSHYNKLLVPTVTVADENSSNLPATVLWYTNWDANQGFSGQIDWSDFHPSSPITIYGHVKSFTKNNSPQQFNTGQSYTLSFTPDSLAKASVILTSTAILSQAFYLLVGKAGGHALGIGKKPEADSQLDINMRWIVLNKDTNRVSNDQNPAIAYRVGNTVVDMIKFSAENNIPANATIEFYNSKKVANNLINSLDSNSNNSNNDTILITGDTSNGITTYTKRTITQLLNGIKPIEIIKW